MIYRVTCDSAAKPEYDLEGFVRGGRDRRLHVHLPELRNPADLPQSTTLTIVGAGLVGIAIAARAWHLKSVGRDMVILDDRHFFAEAFYRRTHAIDQKVMRSPYSHHLAPDEDLSLADFARLHSHLLTPGEQRQLRLARRYVRALPPLDVFLKHTESVVRQHELQRIAFRFCVTRIRRDGSQWLLEDAAGRSLRSRYVILALGQECKEGTFTPNILTQDLLSLIDCPPTTIVVIGSGNTAGHVVVSCIDKGHRVCWVVRNELRFYCTDVPHPYFRTEGLLRFMRYSLDDRIRILRDTFRGSCMPEHYRLFKKFIEKGLLRVYERTVVRSVTRRVGGFRVVLSNGETLNCGRIIEAPGLRLRSLPAIDPPLALYGGFPVLHDHSLEPPNHRNLFIASAHSALSLGPAAKVIDGARLAIERILPTIEAREEGVPEDPEQVYRVRRPKWGKIKPVYAVPR